MALQSISQAPQLGVGFDGSATKDVGFGRADDFYDYQMAKYNNEYNYWLWQQQAEYNSPAQQMARAKQAGLNPNVIAGNVSSGNLGSIPSSNGKLSGNITANKLNLANLGINSFNSLLKAVGEGIDATSKISGIPQDIGSYRNALSHALSYSNESKLVDNTLKSIEIAKTAHLAGVPNDRIGYIGVPDWLLKYAGKNKDGLHLYSIPDSALTKMWDAQANEPSIANVLKNTAISKNLTEIEVQEAQKLLTEAKTKLTNQQYELFSTQVFMGLLLKGLGIAAR